MISKKQWWATGLSLLLFLLLLVGVMTNAQYISAIDYHVLAVIQPIRSSGLDSFFIFLTQTLNEVPAIITVIIIAILVELWQHHLNYAWLLFFNCFIIAGGVNTLIKHIVNRPRPIVRHLVKVSSTSFPSGHSITSMLLGGTVIFILMQTLNQGSKRFILITLICCWIFLIGLSRAYVHVHYPTDVLAGWSLGFVFLTLSEATFLRLENKKRLS